MIKVWTYVIWGCGNAKSSGQSYLSRDFTYLAVSTVNFLGRRHRQRLSAQPAPVLALETSFAAWESFKIPLLKVKIMKTLRLQHWGGKNSLNGRSLGTLIWDQRKYNISFHYGQHKSNRLYRNQWNDDFDTPDVNSAADCKKTRQPLNLIVPS